MEEPRARTVAKLIEAKDEVDKKLLEMIELRKAIELEYDSNDDLRSTIDQRLDSLLSDEQLNVIDDKYVELVVACLIQFTADEKDHRDAVNTKLKLL